MKLIPESLANYGFTNIIHVPEQDVPSGDFPTVESPNPEVPSAMAMAVPRLRRPEPTSWWLPTPTPTASVP